MFLNNFRIIVRLITLLNNISCLEINNEALRKQASNASNTLEILIDRNQKLERENSSYIKILKDDDNKSTAINTIKKLNDDIDNKIG